MVGPLALVCLHTAYVCAWPPGGSYLRPGASLLVGFLGRGSRIGAPVPRCAIRAWVQCGKRCRRQTLNTRCGQGRIAHPLILPAISSDGHLRRSLVLRLDTSRAIAYCFLARMFLAHMPARSSFHSEATHLGMLCSTTRLLRVLGERAPFTLGVGITMIEHWAGTCVSAGSCANVLGVVGALQVQIASLKMSWKKKPIVGT